MTDKRNRLSRLDRERHIFQNPVLILVSKPNVLKFNSAARSFSLDWFGGIQNSDRQIERSEEAMRRNDSSLQHVVLIRNVANGLEEKARVLNESDKSTQCQHRMTRRVLHNSISAVPNNQRDPDRSDEIYQWEEHCVIE